MNSSAPRETMNVTTTVIQRNQDGAILQTEVDLNLPRCLQISFVLRLHYSKKDDQVSIEPPPLPILSLGFDQSIYSRIRISALQALDAQQ